MTDLQAVLIQAIQFHESGQFEQALNLYVQLLEHAPEHPTFLHLVGLLHHQQQNFPEAINFLKKAFEHDQESPQIPYDLANAFQANEQLDEAVEYYQKSLKLNPEYSEALNNFGVIKQQQGENEEALSCFQKAIQFKADYSEAYFNSGNVYKELSKPDLALESYQKSIQLNPAYDKAWNNIGLLWHDKQEFKQAIEALLEALKISPDYADAHFNLGKAYQENQQTSEAIHSFEQAIHFQKDFVKAYFCLALLYIKLENYNKATELLIHTLKTNDNHPILLANLGQLYMVDQHYDKAIETHKKVLTTSPDLVEVRYLLAEAYFADEQFELAIETLQKILSQEPDHLTSHCLLITIYKMLLDEEKMHFHFDQAIKHSRENNSTLHSALLFAIFGLSGLSKRKAFQYFKDWGNLNEPQIQHNYYSDHKKDPHRRIRVGYISPDFYHHSAATLFDAIFSCHNDKDFEIFCYSDSNRHDSYTHYFQSYANHWRETRELNSLELLELITFDKIDILVDLAGHTAKNRLEVFTYKPAPIQVTGLGYGFTSGSSRMDIRLSDQLLTPSEIVRYNTEKVLYLPTLMHWQPPATNIELEDLPFNKNDFLTLGCGNNQFKITEPFLETIAKILQALPNAQFCLKDRVFSMNRVREKHLEFFKKHNISEDRIQFFGYSSHSQHLHFYQKLDIVVDPFPYNGGITSCEALWMGVPVISLENSSRVGLSILSQLNLPELIAKNEEDYISIIKGLDQDRSKLNDYHKTLRKKLLDSALCSPFQYTHSIERAYKALWTQWCHQEK